MKEDGEPIEGLAPCREDGVDRERPLGRVPDREGDAQQYGKDDDRGQQLHAVSTRLSETSVPTTLIRTTASQ